MKSKNTNKSNRISKQVERFYAKHNIVTNNDSNNALNSSGNFKYVWEYNEPESKVSTTVYPYKDK